MALTLKEIAQMDCVYLTPTQAAPLLGCAPYYISLMSKTEEGRKGLGFPVIRMNTRTKILRVPFLRYLGWEGKIRGAEEEDEAE